MRLRTLPIFLAFLVMGVADAMGPLADAVRAQYQLSNVVSTLLTFFVFIAFAAFSVPGGVMAARIGKKKLLLLALGLNILAVAVPALRAPSFGLLLGCIFVLGVGTTFLQVAGNPIMRDVSEPGAYARNLSFAQFIKGVGSSGSSWLVGLAAALPLLGAMGWRSVFPIFLALMVLAFLAVAALPIHEEKADEPPSLGSSLALLKEPAFALAVLGIFLYVGAEVCMARFLKPALSAQGLDDAKAALLGPTLFFAAITAGRLLGSAVLLRMSAPAFFRISAALGLLGPLAALGLGRAGAFAAPVLAGLGFANIWPLLFAITVERRPERGSELSGLMCMAIAGGAVIPLLMGRIADGAGLRTAFIVPAACFVYLAFLAARPAPKLEA
ncbi:MAG TPA: MFS transporter [Holophagaceae bacterium]|nr:MFS transporter [Holophagaceae bacterium]